MPTHCHIDDRIRAAAPGLALGFISAQVAVRAEDADLKAELESTAERLKHELAGKELASLPAIQALRRFYHRLGKDPTRYRGSNEALLRRILQGKALYFINSVVDVCNLTSLETQHSLGAFDRERITGDVTFRPGAPGEAYEGIGRGSINLEGLPVFCDSLGPFGSLTSDSERTKITLETRRITFVIIALCDTERLPAQLERTASLLKRYGAATEIEQHTVR